MMSTRGLFECRSQAGLRERLHLGASEQPQGSALHHHPLKKTHNSPRPAVKDTETRACRRGDPGLRCDALAPRLAYHSLPPCWNAEAPQSFQLKIPRNYHETRRRRGEHLEDEDGETLRFPPLSSRKTPSLHFLSGSEAGGRSRSRGGAKSLAQAARGAATERIRKSVSRSGKFALTIKPKKRDSAGDTLNDARGARCTGVGAPRSLQSALPALRPPRSVP